MLKSTRGKIIGFVIIIVAIIVLIGGYLLYRNYTIQNEERSNLISEIQKNHLTDENAGYLQDQNFLSISQWNALREINQNASDNNLKLSNIKDLRKKQKDILDPINQKLNGKDNDVTKSLDYNLKLLSESGVKVTDDILNVTEVKNKATEKIDLEKTVNENTELVRKKIDSLNALKKVAFNKKALLNGDFSSIAGTYVNMNGKEGVVQKNGNIEFSNEKTKCKGLKATFDKKLGFYRWPISCSGGGAVGFFFPIGVKVVIMADGRTINVGTDTNKNRISFGQQLGNGSQYYYVRK